MKTAVVTGANQGIGLALCRELLARNYQVIATCRRPSRELESTQAEVISGIDVTNPSSVEMLGRHLGGRPLDLLVNNAGVLTMETLERLDFERIRRQFEVNTLGPLRVTQALLSNLRRGSKVAMVTSRMGSIGDNSSGGYYGYRLSKAAVNMAGVNLAHDLRRLGIAVLILHPGLVATEMTGGAGISPEESAANMLARLDELALEQSGVFMHARGERLPW